MKLNIMDGNGNPKEIEAYLLKNTPIKCFAHRDTLYWPNPNAWVVSEFFSGMKITTQHETRKSAIEDAILFFENKPLEIIKNQVNLRVKQYGFANKDGTERSSKKD